MLKNIIKRFIKTSKTLENLHPGEGAVISNKVITGPAVKDFEKVVL